MQHEPAEEFVPRVWAQRVADAAGIDVLLGDYKGPRTASVRLGLEVAEELIRIARVVLDQWPSQAPIAGELARIEQSLHKAIEDSAAADGRSSDS
jgi:hypothetical protein